MMDLGGFVRSAFPESDLPQLAYAPFPEIVPGVARYEDFAVNSVHIPANGKNKTRPAISSPASTSRKTWRLSLAAEGAIPPRNDCPPSSDPLVNAAVEELKKVVGTSQYYDRDTDPDMAQEGLTGIHGQAERRDEFLRGWKRPAREFSASHSGARREQSVHVAQKCAAVLGQRHA